MVGDEGAGDRDLAWLLDDLASRVKDFKRAVILSRDGLLLAASQGPVQGRGGALVGGRRGPAEPGDGDRRALPRGRGPADGDRA